MGMFFFLIQKRPPMGEMPPATPPIKTFAATGRTHSSASSLTEMSRPSSTAYRKRNSIPFIKSGTNKRVNADIYSEITSVTKKMDVNFSQKSGPSQHDHEPVQPA